MSYVQELLARNEHVVRVARDHWITLLTAFLVDAAVSVVIIGLSVVGIILSPPWTWFGFLLLSVPIGHFMFRVWAWWNKQYIVTNRRIIQIAGAFNKRVSDTLLEKINDIVMDQSALGRTLGFGDIQLISGSESGDDVFHRIAHPVEFKRELLEQKDALTGLGASREEAGESTAAGEISGLIAELDELRHKGLITEAEFEEKKRQLLDRI